MGWKTAWLFDRVRRWDGSWESWTALLILLGMTLAVGLVIYFRFHPGEG